MVFPWNDYSGRLSPLKLAVFMALFVPAGWVAFAYGFGLLGARPLNEAIHEIGLWTIRLIFLALAVTPLRQVLQWPRLILVRRMIGVGAFAYALTHFTLYTASQAFDLEKVASEIALRVYLTIGFAALVGLAALAATSTDGMIRRLGAKRWQVLHRLVYAIAVLAVIHYCFQSKLVLWEPTVMAGLLGWLLGYRLLSWRFASRGHLALGWVGGLSLAAGIATAFGEAAYFRLAFHAPLLRVLETNVSLATGLRPAAVVLAIGLAVTAAGAARQALLPPARQRSRRAPPRITIPDAGAAVARASVAAGASVQGRRGSSD
ncbi:MAG TPA: protein-methionine-sulfoxide reductase heme-binding subunit MsrQ [Stellaceae bacterium]|jgi:sulfoxide reductase heme-binding subunit YedZ|nr:protein-methionine-sulfoxide reductase heme-binding subunit MsrQ [Stellaceae bacterium]